MGKQKDDFVVLKKGKKEIPIDYTEVRKAVLVLRAINHDRRQQIIQLLAIFFVNNLRNFY